MLRSIQVETDVGTVVLDLCDPIPDELIESGVRLGIEHVEGSFFRVTHPDGRSFEAKCRDKWTPKETEHDA